MALSVPSVSQYSSSSIRCHSDITYSFFSLRFDSSSQNFSLDLHTTRKIVLTFWIRQHIWRRYHRYRWPFYWHDRKPGYFCFMFRDVVLRKGAVLNWRHEDDGIAIILEECKGWFIDVVRLIDERTMICRMKVRNSDGDGEVIMNCRCTYLFSILWKSWGLLWSLIVIERTWIWIFRILLFQGNKILVRQSLLILISKLPRHIHRRHNQTRHFLAGEKWS